MIAVPTGTQFFCWIATMWSGRVASSRLADALDTRILHDLPHRWLTGVMLAAVPLNTQVHDTFFVVAHIFTTC